VRIRRRGYLAGCCDCGLVHRVDTRVRDGAIEQRIDRDEEATRWLRRWYREHRRKVKRKR
jgi:hypothetical protein